MATSQILGFKPSRRLILVCQYRYRAFLHLVPLKPYGKIIVPLNHIDERFEFLEEVRFVKYATSAAFVGLRDYIMDVAIHLYGAAHINWSKGAPAYELNNEYGLTIATAKEVGRPRKNDYSYYQMYSNYFERYATWGSVIAGKYWCYESPYPDEEEFPDDLDLEIYYKEGDPRRRIKIAKRVSE